MRTSGKRRGHTGAGAHIKSMWMGTKVASLGLHACLALPYTHWASTLCIATIRALGSFSGPARSSPTRRRVSSATPLAAG
eukprot:9472791-Alexandrium_andersonii.AAC.1